MHPRSFLFAILLSLSAGAMLLHSPGELPLKAEALFEEVRPAPIAVAGPRHHDTHEDALLRGGILFREGRTIEAIGTWALVPPSSPASEAAAGCRRLVEEFLDGTTNREAVLAYLDGVLHGLGLGAVKSPERALERAAGLAPASAEIWFRLAQQRMAQGNEEEAMAAFRRAIRLDPLEARYRIATAQAYLRSGKIKAARSAAAAASSLDPQSPRAVMMEGIAELHLGHPAAARPLLAKAERLSADDPAVLLDLGLTHLDSGDPELGRRCFFRALELSPSSKHAANNLGIALLQLGKPAEATTVLEKALRIDPEFRLAAINLADAYRLRGKTASARLIVQETLDKDKTFAPAHFMLGRIARTEGKTGEAIAHLERAAKLEPNLAETHFALGEAHLRGRSDPKTALPHLARALELSPQDPETLAMMATCYYEKGEPAKSWKFARIAERIRPEPVRLILERLATASEKPNSLDACEKECESLSRSGGLRAGTSVELCMLASCD